MKYFAVKKDQGGRNLLEERQTVKTYEPISQKMSSFNNRRPIENYVIKPFECYLPYLAIKVEGSFSFN